MKLLLVAGARPNFMKIAALIRACKKLDVNYEVVHTGQHYDKMMSEIFFTEFELNPPNYNMVVGSGTHAEQTAKIIEQFEEVYNISKPDIVVVVGDVNSTFGCAIVVSKMPGGKLAHVEAGMRSFDRTMPEEINRIATDVLSNFLFCADSESFIFLKHHPDISGIIMLAGDVMIDNLLYYIDKVETIISYKPRILVTVHRQGNTDNKEKLESILKSLHNLSLNFDISFPMHPRTKSAILKHDLYRYLENKKISFIDPVGYKVFLRLLKSADIVLTDSGSIQIETSVLNKRCLTLRENTERLITLRKGTNELVGTKTEDIVSAVYRRMKKQPKSKLRKDNLYDGTAAERIIGFLRREYES